MLVPFERNQGGLRCRGWSPQRQVETVDGVKKKESPNSLVKVVAATPEIVERRAFLQQLFSRKSGADVVKRLIANGRVSCRDKSNQFRHSSSETQKGMSSEASPLRRGLRGGFDLF